MLNELRFALRSLRKNPGVTAVAVLTLALGIGPTTAVYSVVEGVLLRPLPYRDAGRLVIIGWVPREYYRPGMRLGTQPYPAQVRAWRTQSRSFDDMSAYVPSNPVLTGLGDARRVEVWAARSNLFPMLGVQPLLGRGFTAEDDQPGSAPVVVLSYAFWASQFGRDPRVRGGSVTLDGIAYRVVGVMPPQFRFPVMPPGFRSAGTDMWRSAGSLPAALRSPESMAWLMGRLRPNVTIRQARADLDRVLHDLARTDPRFKDMRAIVAPALDTTVGDVRLALLLALGAVGLVLLVACANAANLLLARAVARGRETAIRTALGAGRLRVMRQALIEAVLLALAGAAAGVVLAAWGIPLLVALAGTSLPRLANVAINLQVLAATAGAAVVTGILFGLVPALQAVRRGSSADALKEGGAAAGMGKGHARASGAFVVGQIALTLMLLVGAGLLGRSFVKLMTLDPGFDPDHALVAQVHLPGSRYGTTAQKLAFAQAAIERARALPGVTDAAVSTGTPLAVGAIGSISVPGEPERAEAPWASFTGVTPDFFQLLGIPLRRGRLFAPGDRGATRPVVVSEALVKAFFEGQDPIGKRVAFYGNSFVGTIVGVVGDTREMSLSATPPPVIYEPLADDASSYLKVIVRAAGDPAVLAGPLRTALRGLDPDLPVDELHTMRDMMAESIATQRFYATLVGVFAALALLMAAAGLYALISYAVARRTRELGLRIALGAEAPQVLALVIRRSALLTLLGIVLGAGGAFAVTRVFKSFLFEITPTDPVTFVGVALGLLFVAFLASYVPARRATRVDPMQALRYE